MELLGFYSDGRLWSLESPLAVPKVKRNSTSWAWVIWGTHSKQVQVSPMCWPVLALSFFAFLVSPNPLDEIPAS